AGFPKGLSVLMTYAWASAGARPGGSYTLAPTGYHNGVRPRGSDTAQIRSILLQSRRHLLGAAALDRGGDAQRLAILGGGAAGDVDAVLLQVVDELVVAEHRLRRLGVDQVADAVADRLGGMGLAAAIGRRDGRGEEILELEDAAWGRHVLVRRDTAHR